MGSSPARLADQIAFFAPFTPPGARILEIGCATGELAAATQELLSVSRFEAIELSPAADAAERAVHRVYRQPLRELIGNGQIDSAFDLVLMSHVLEHLEDPHDEVQAIGQILKPGGAIFLEVPNGSGNRRLPIDDNRAHLHFFSIASLTRLLAKHGFDTIASQTDAVLDARYADSLRVLAKRFNLPFWSSTLLSDDPTLRGEEKIVVWGAGSLSIELLANFFDASKIDFFIDKNVQLQASTLLGKPVLSPAELGSTPRTVLLNSIDFAASIASDIKRMYPGVPHRLVPVADLLGQPATR